MSPEEEAEMQAIERWYQGIESLVDLISQDEIDELKHDLAKIGRESKPPGRTDVVGMCSCCARWAQMYMPAGRPDEPSAFVCLQCLGHTS